MKKLILIFIVPFLLTSIWFGQKKMLAHAEEGLPFYNPIRTFQMSSYLWQDTGLGFTNPFSLPRISLHAFSAGLSALRVPSLRIQQLIFFLLIVTPLISIPPLTKLLLPNSREYTRLYAALLYVFNLFFLSQVLQRFIYELFFLWSYLPLFLYIWIRWLDSRKVRYLLLLVITSFIFSNIFTLTASIFSLWIPAGIVWLKYRKFVPAIIGVTVWLLAAAWWWYPLATKENSYTRYLNVSSNVRSLIDVSKYYPNSEIVLLKQNYYFGSRAIWSKYFSSRPIHLISQLLVGLLVVGIVSTLRLPSGKVLLIWLIAGWFLVKGANPPWGESFYSWLFNSIPVTMVLRNPYEKLGVVFLLPYSLLVALGLSKIPSRHIRTLILFVVCFVLLRPMWTAQVFAGYQIEVPPSYQLADGYLNGQSGFRLLHLPFLHGSGLEYNWGYSGDEPSEYTFSRPSVSKTYFFPDDPYLLIYQYLRSPNLYRLMQFFVIDTLVVHKDVLPGPTVQENYEGTKSMTSQMRNVRLTKSFDALDVYQLENVPVNWGYLSNDVTETETLKKGLNMVVNSDDFVPLLSAFSLSADIPKIDQSKLPSYKIVKISPVHYRYQIKDANSPYILILSVNYNNLWIAKVNDDVIDKHFAINGYANGWQVDKLGNYEINVTFKVWPWE
ncbi:MAG: Uncharacterized protein G01um101416_69 [Microgenomates group bacterium Gr01-1014_16]|nr:MAG: Uncharacterized protein G01um101416_69 [Microgenomates group bacterium Gr01-1014_16]